MNKWLIVLKPGRDNFTESQIGKICVPDVLPMRPTIWFRHHRFSSCARRQLGIFCQFRGCYPARLFLSHHRAWYPFAFACVIVAAVQSIVTDKPKPTRVVQLAVVTSLVAPRFRSVAVALEQMAFALSCGCRRRVSVCVSCEFPVARVSFPAPWPFFSVSERSVICCAGSDWIMCSPCS